PGLIRIASVTPTGISVRASGRYSFGAGDDSRPGGTVNSGTTPTISSQGPALSAPGVASPLPTTRTRRPRTGPPPRTRSTKALSTMTVLEPGAASDSTNPRPARTGTSNTAKRLVSIWLTH